MKEPNTEEKNPPNRKKKKGKEKPAKDREEERYEGKKKPRNPHLKIRIGRRARFDAIFFRPQIGRLKQPQGEHSKQELYPLLRLLLKIFLFLLPAENDPPFDTLSGGISFLSLPHFLSQNDAKSPVSTDRREFRQAVLLNL